MGYCWCGMHCCFQPNLWFLQSQTDQKRGNAVAIAALAVPRRLTASWQGRRALHRHRAREGPVVPTVAGSRDRPITGYLFPLVVHGEVTNPACSEHFMTGRAFRYLLTRLALFALVCRMFIHTSMRVTMLRCTAWIYSRWLITFSYTCYLFQLILVHGGWTT